MATTPPIALDRAHVKGLVFRAFVVSYAAVHGRTALDSAVGRLDPTVRAAFDVTRPALGILPWRWYPAAHVHALLDAVSARLTPDERAAALRESNEHAIGFMLAGPFRRFVAAVTSPELYARHVQHLWDLLHDTGRRTITFRTKTEVESVVVGWAGHHPLLCEVVSETTRSVFDAIGCDDVQRESLACIARGDAACITRIWWREP